MTRPGLSMPRRGFVAGAVAAVAAGGRRGRAASPDTLRVAEQFGIGYLPLHVIREQGLVEKHARARGSDVAVEWVRLSGGAALNDALISGAVDIAAGGVTPLLTVWDRTRSSLGVRAISSLVSMPYYLVTSNPKLGDIADLGPQDKIALPSVGVSIQARTLQMAAAQRWGDDQWARLEPYTVTLPHPEATAAILSGSAGVTAHFSAPPFQNHALAKGSVRRLLSSYDVLGGPTSAILVWSADRLRSDRPDAYGAFAAAVEEAVAFVAADRRAAALTYRRVEDSRIDQGFLLSILEDPEIAFTTTPQHTDRYAAFMHKIGAIKARPAGWQDYFFPEAHRLAGS